MAKDPAFLFYTSDFLAGVSDLTMEERGQYITLLCLQHQKGRLSKKNIGIAVPNATADTMAKFKIDESGLYFNERLEMEINNRKAFTEKQRQRAIDGWEKRKSKLDATANATALPLEDVNVNTDIVIEKNIIRYYKKFLHLKLTFDEFDKLIGLGYNKNEIDETLELIENYKKNTNYKSLFLTAKKWLKNSKEFDKNKKSDKNIPKTLEEKYSKYY